MRFKIALTLIFAATIAHAQMPIDSAPPPSAWNQLLAQIQPSLIAFLVIAIPSFFGYLGIVIQGLSSRAKADSQRAQVHAAAATGAAQVFAASPPTSDLQTKQIDPTGPEVASVAAWVNGPGAGDAVKALGLSAADVNGKALGALGAQQMAAPVPPTK